MAGNWKMNMTHLEAIGLVQKLAFSLPPDKDLDKFEVVVLPPFTALRSVQTLITGDNIPIGFGGQDLSPHETGAYTGEVSAAMLSKLGCSYVVTGHSERREYHREDDALVNAKSRKAFAAGMIPIVCVGEGLEVRQAGDQVSHTLAQIDGSLAEFSPEEVAQLVVAYEPVWAIGTGEVATPDDAQEVCGALRARLAERFGDETAAVVRILYGGSVKAGNIGGILAGPDIDGALVGGASLDADEFARICTHAAEGS
jgi:triosephosphate isomerase